MRKLPKKKHKLWILQVGAVVVEHNQVYKIFVQYARIGRIPTGAMPNFRKMQQTKKEEKDWILGF